MSTALFIPQQVQVSNHALVESILSTIDDLELVKSKGLTIEPEKNTGCSEDGEQVFL